MVAATPDGRIGVAWTRQLSRYVRDHWEYNLNIIFAVLHSSGSLAYGPLNLTNNNGWENGDNSTIVPWFSNVRIAGLQNNRFLLSWYRDSEADIYYTVFDSSGSAETSINNLSADGTNIDDYQSDAAQLSDGRIAIAWDAWENASYKIRFAILDSSYNRIAGPTILSNPASVTGDRFVSLSADISGRAVLTWMESGYSYRTNLYYAMVNSSGNVVTPPMIFMTDKSIYPYLETSYNGYGNTTYSSATPAGVDTALLMSAGATGGAPGEAVPVFVDFTNHGQITATSVSFSMTLGSGVNTINSDSASGLTYLFDTSGTTPVIVGETITWNLPDVPFLQKVSFIVYLGVPLDAPIGTTYPLAFNLAAADETNPGDNGSDGQVMAGMMMYLPNVLK